MGRAGGNGFNSQRSVSFTRMDYDEDWEDLFALIDR